MEVNRRRTQAERTAATRASLISAARTLFAQQGYAAVGTQAIVDAAGVTRGALYHQFVDKRGLFAAVFDTVEEEAIGAAAAAAMAAATDDPLAALTLGFDAVMNALADPGITRITMIDAPAVLGWEAWRERGERYGMAVIETMLTRAIEVGAIDPQPVRPLAHILLGALDESALYVSRAADREDALAQMRPIVQRIVYSFAR